MDKSKILVIQLRQIGDTILATPVFRQLRRLYPHAAIDCLCQGANADVLRHNPCVRRIDTLPRASSIKYFLELANRLKHRKYDMVVDIQSLPKTAILSWLTRTPTRLGQRRPWRHWLYTKSVDARNLEYTAVHRLRLLSDSRVDLGDYDVEFPTSEADREQARRFCQSHFKYPVAAIYGCRADFSRAWAAENYASIADRLAEQGFMPYLVFGPGEQHAARMIAARMRHPALVEYDVLSLPVLKETLAACSLMVTCDGGPKHIAVSAGLPTVTMYWRENAVYWNPPNSPRHRVVATHIDDPPSSLVGTVTRATSTDEISVEDVWQEVVRLLSHVG